MIACKNQITCKTNRKNKFIRQYSVHRKWAEKPKGASKSKHRFEFGGFWHGRINAYTFNFVNISGNYLNNQVQPATESLQTNQIGMHAVNYAKEGDLNL